MRILITGTTGDSMPPPYGGIPKVSLLYARAWREIGHTVAVTFVYKPENADDFGAQAEYFFEYTQKPNKLTKIIFLIKYFIKNPVLYFLLLSSYIRIYPKIQIETILYSAYGVYMDSVISTYKPDIIVSETALIKTHMILEIARTRHIPVVIDTYAEIRDKKMGVNKHLSEMEQKKYWVAYLNRAQLIIGMSNCTDGPRKYVSGDKIKEFYDTCDFAMSRTDISESKEELRKYFGLPEKSFIVGAVGAFDARKGYSELIRAVAKRVNEGDDVVVVICGAGDSSEWRELAIKENIADRAYFFTSLKEIELIKFHKTLDLYSNMSNSSRSCGYDLALLEAMASALPVIVSDTGVLSTAVEEGINGYVTKTNDINSIASGIHLVYQKSSDERKKMGERSREVVEKYDIRTTSKIKYDWLDEVRKKYIIT